MSDCSAKCLIGYGFQLLAHSLLLIFLSDRDDIVRSIKTLKPLSSGFEILLIGSRRMVRSVPKELDTDQSSLLLLAQVSIYL